MRRRWVFAKFVTSVTIIKFGWDWEVYKTKYICGEKIFWGENVGESFTTPREKMVIMREEHTRGGVLERKGGG